VHFLLGFFSDTPDLSETRFHSILRYLADGGSPTSFSSHFPQFSPELKRILVSPPGSLKELQAVDRGPKAVFLSDFNRVGRKGFSFVTGMLPPCTVSDLTKPPEIGVDK